ncbi:hypothetical protein DOTSEDRAFT_72842 [Dothistroma septosporum NZE10]|uniref:BZIP domain-containing protein n=1 Tax=Dothistroma septosporum (strain NZE10 / CBS 128990) TaxID=675120 RepID=M2YPQ6_DOTSN|nr:hypothetical protein DOTSEDRAFT_72842 [Dothistroma septosporum NZE10]
MASINLDAFQFGQPDCSDQIDSANRDRTDTVVSGMQHPHLSYHNNNVNIQQITSQQPYYGAEIEQQQNPYMFPVDVQQQQFLMSNSFRNYDAHLLDQTNEQLRIIADQTHPQPFNAGWQSMSVQPHPASPQDQSPDGKSYALQQQQQQLYGGGQGRLHSAGSDGSVSPRSQKVPIAHQRSYSGAPSPTGLSSDQPTMVHATGPMSTNIKIPQRPKPGRKPIPQEDAVDRRRMQNRMAQRSFRDKRQQKLADALKELDEKRREYEASISQYRRDLQKTSEDNAKELQDLQAQLKAALQRAENAEHRAEAEKQRADELETQLQGMKPNGEHSVSFRPSARIPTQSFASYAQRDVPTPPEDNGNEIDFTSYGRSAAASSNYLRNTVSNDSNQMDFIMAERNDDDDNCGFCTDDQNCACKQAASKTIVEPTVELSAPKTLPGSCDMCQADPIRAQACRDMAKSATMAPKPKVTMGPPKYSCSQMIEEFNKFGQRTTTISSLFGGALHTYPNSTGPGYTLDDKEAGEVLMNLARRSTEVDSERRASQASHTSTIQ